MDNARKDLDYLEPVEVADGIFWVGFADENAELYCNPYLVVDGNEAVLIDGGSRDDFSTVMLKILRIGIEPKQIKKLIYSHFDPDLCGNINQFESLIDSDELRIISHKDSNIYINYYSRKTPKLSIDDMGYKYEFPSGRELKFIHIPYSHASGSFITYDCKTKTLFTSDLFGSFDSNWDLYLKLDPQCRNCKPHEFCQLSHKNCRLHGIIRFHRKIMTSTKALRYAINQIEKLDIKIIAPQHGSIIDNEQDIQTVIKHLKAIEDVGIDHFLGGIPDER